MGDKKMKMRVSLVLVICAAPISIFNLLAQNVNNDFYWVSWLLMSASAICLSIERAASLICYCLIQGQKLNIEEWKNKNNLNEPINYET